MRKKTIFDDINTSNKFQVSINESANALFIKIKVNPKEEGNGIESAWMSIDYADIDDLIDSIKDCKRKIESKM